MVQKPVAAGLFELVDGRPHLIGGRRKSDGRFVFPMPEGGEAQYYDAVPLRPEGTLWSHTVQRFRPKSPPYSGDDDERSFRPFALGYVELEGQVIVESRIVIDDFSRLAVGMKLELAVVPFRREADGTEIMTYAFKPAA